MYKLSQKHSKNMIFVFLTILGLFLIYTGVIKIYNEIFGYHVRARFLELEPLESNLSVYCKGKKIGETKGITLNRDYKFSTIKILFYPQNLLLPKNSIAKIKKVDAIANYMEIIYPKEPSKEFLKSGDTLKGEIAMDFDTLIAMLGESGDLGTIVGDFSKIINNIEDVSDDIGQFFEVVISVVEENRERVNQTTKNAQSFTNNLNQVSAKFNNTIKESNLKKVISNIDESSGTIKTSTDNFKESSQSIKEITKNVDNATKNLDVTVANVDKTVCDARVITSNVKCITCGIKQVLQKRFAGLRIIFGKPLD